MSHKKFGPDRFSRFDVYWIQTDRQTNKQTDKPNLYIDIYLFTCRNLEHVLSRNTLHLMKMNLPKLFLCSTVVLFKRFTFVCADYN